MTNDYMFRAVLQKNQFVLKGLVGSLLHLDPESLEVEVTNPIKLGESFENKDFILDVNVKVNNKTLLNLEMQIINYGNWKERSLSYLCRSFDNVYKSHDYLEASPVIQISFLDFELFPEYPEFFSTYMVTVHSVPVTSKNPCKICNTNKFVMQMDFYLATLRFLTDLAVNAKSCLNCNLGSDTFRSYLWHFSGLFHLKHRIKINQREIIIILCSR